MKDKTVTIYKTTAVGPSTFIFTSGHPDPLKFDARDRRFFIVEGVRTGKQLIAAHPGDVAVVPPNA